MMGPDFNTRNDLLRHQSFSGAPVNLPSDQSRPGSRASVRSEYQHSKHQRQDSAPLYPHEQQQTTQQTEIYYNEDGQPRKRARVLQTDWHGRSSFGSKSADLRVTAATAASMHMHRPIPKRPVAPGSNLEPPPRVPTPVPQRTQMLPHQQQRPRRSMLRQASQADSDFMSDVGDFSDAIVSSPEDDSPGNSITAEGTPQEIPSSPPVFPGMNQPQPSSPGLPTLPPQRMADSGYMSERGFPSGAVMDTMENNEDREYDAFDFETAAQYRARSKPPKPVFKMEGDGSATPQVDYDVPQKDMNIEMVVPGDPNQLPQKMLLNLQPGRREGSQGPRPVPLQRSTTTRTPSEAPGSRRGSLALPPNSLPFSSDLPDAQAKQRPVQRKRQSLHRSRTGSNESDAGSPAPSDTEGGRPKGLGRSGSGAQRRKLIEQRLVASIAKGNAPQYCSHCGSIETPTWRRLYVKECEGKPERLDEVEGEGETIGLEITETDEETGEATKFLIRKSMKKTKDNLPGVGFEDVVVCNPCGLWFNKFRVMRPPEKWKHHTATRKSKKQRAAEEPGLSTDGYEPQSDMLFMDQAMQEDFGADNADDNCDSQLIGRASVAPVRGRPRANSMQVQQAPRSNGRGELNASQVDAALAREVQSSPARFHGSQVSPIEIDDLTPKPTRRLLFPSPRREGEVRSLDDNSQVSLKAMPSATSVQQYKANIELDFRDNNTNAFEAFTFDKENTAPGFGQGALDDDLADLFDGSPSAYFKTPHKTPAKSTTTPRSLRQLQHLLKTPTPNRSLKRKVLTPNANAANGANLNGTANPAINDFMTSPSSGRYFLRSTPSRVERTGNTPGRHSNNSNELSPWSRHLSQMLSDAHDGSNQFTSPSRAAFDFSDLPTFNTPGREWEALDSILDSDFGGFGEGGGGAEAVGEQM